VASERASQHLAQDRHPGRVTVSITGKDLASESPSRHGQRPSSVHGHHSGMGAARRRETTRADSRKGVGKGDSYGRLGDSPSCAHGDISPHLSFPACLWVFRYHSNSWGLTHFSNFHFCKKEAL
jgi:hypothetical protein